MDEMEHALIQKNWYNVGSEPQNGGGQPSEPIPVVPTPLPACSLVIHVIIDHATDIASASCDRNGQNIILYHRSKCCNQQQSIFYIH